MKIIKAACCPAAPSTAAFVRLKPIKCVFTLRHSSCCVSQLSRRRVIKGERFGSSGSHACKLNAMICSTGRFFSLHQTFPHFVVRLRLGLHLVSPRSRQEVCLMHSLPNFSLTFFIVEFILHSPATLRGHAGLFLSSRRVLDASGSIL